MEHHPSLTDSLRRATVTLQQHIATIAAKTDAFLEKFPQDTRMGLLRNESPSKELISAYSICASDWTLALGHAEVSVAQISQTMQGADLEHSTEVVLQCDRILDRYLNFKRAFNSILKTGTGIAIARAELSLAEWLKQLREFDYRTKQFMDFLTSEANLISESL